MCRKDRCVMKRLIGETSDGDKYYKDETIGQLLKRVLGEIQLEFDFTGDIDADTPTQSFHK